MSTNYRFIGVIHDKENGITINVATEKGTVRQISLTTAQALTLIRDVAGYLRTQERKK